MKRLEYFLFEVNFLNYIDNTFAFLVIMHLAVCSADRAYFYSVAACHTDYYGTLTTAIDATSADSDNPDITGLAWSTDSSFLVTAAGGLVQLTWHVTQPDEQSMQLVKPSGQVAPGLYSLLFICLCDTYIVCAKNG